MPQLDALERVVVVGDRDAVLAAPVDELKYSSWQAAFGGGTQVITVGQRCLLGANSGLGISLGDDCVIEAGLYLTAGTIVTLPGGRQAKARELSGSSGLVFRRNSVTGAVEAVTRPDKRVSLTADLHSGQ